MLIGKRCRPSTVSPHVLSADRHGDHLLDVGEAQAETGCTDPVDPDFHVASAANPLGVGRARAGDGLHGRLDLLSYALDHLQVGACDLDPHGTLDAGGQHVDAVADRLHPEIGQPRQGQGGIHLIDQLILGFADGPEALGFEANRGLEHFQTRRIGGCLCAAHFAENLLHFRKTHQDLVGLLQ